MHVHTMDGKLQGRTVQTINSNKTLYKSKNTYWPRLGRYWMGLLQNTRSIINNRSKNKWSDSTVFGQGQVTLELFNLLRKGWKVQPVTVIYKKVHLNE